MPTPMRDLHREAATAIVVSFQHFEFDPLKFQEIQSKPRYYAFRVLLHYCLTHFSVQVPAYLVAKYVGYKGQSAKVVCCASQEKVRGYDKNLRDYLYAKFEDKLQNCVSVYAPIPAVADVQLPAVPASSDTVKPQLKTSLKPLSFKTEISDLPHYVSANDMHNVKRSKLEDMLRDAVLNTGGRLVGE